MSEPKPAWQKGPIAWMAHNSVAANLLMFVLLAGGLLMATKVKQEVFPEFTLGLVSVSVVYPGASPEEVEKGIVLVVEEAVQGLDGVKRVTSQALEGMGSVSIELLDGTDESIALADVKAAVDSIRSMPEEAERPRTSLFVAKNQVITLVIYGPQDEETLRALADKARDELLQDEHITLVELTGTKVREIAVEVPQRNLRAYGLSLSGIAGMIKQSTVELPAGTIKGPAGHTLLRTSERRDFGDDVREISLMQRADGTTLKVDQVATIHDGFQESDLITTFEGQPAIQIQVFRVGNQTPIEVADAVKAYAERLGATLTGGLKVGTWNDRSEIYRGRIDLLVGNGKLGLILVFVALGLFLELRLAFWVMLGIPISFAGTFLLMPGADVSINMISLFAFIVTLGIVVDDAIVVGENIHEKRSEGMPLLQAAVEGARQVSVPVVFAVLTTVAAFAPLYFVPGVSGKFFRVIPLVVISVILMSLIESLFILPAHLAHLKPPKTTGISGFIHRQQQKVSGLLSWLVKYTYTPALKIAVSHRFTTIAVAFAMLFVTAGYVGGGHIDFTFMPKVEGDTVKVSAQLPVGIPVSETIALRDRLVRTGQEVVARHGGEAITRGMMAQVGASLDSRGPMHGIAGATGAGTSHLVDVYLRLVPGDEREVTAAQIAREWRAANQDLLNIKRISFSSALRSAAGASLDVILSHRDVDTLEKAAADLAAKIAEYEGATDVDDGFEGGKPQLDLTLRPSAKALGLTELDLARQVRAAFYGAEALRQQRGRDEVKVMVRLPAEDRETLAGFEHLMVRTPGGRYLPLGEAAFITPGNAPTSIQREEGRRIIHVTADVDTTRGNAGKIVAGLEESALPELFATYPGLTHTQAGQARDRKETFAALKTGFLMALFVIYALLAVPFRSYVQPAIIMTAIPFGIVGAVAGHVMLGYEMSVISMMGIVALSGVVVNDSLILVVAINEYRAKGLSVFDSIIKGGARRFRPILLTSLTTFFGLLPMITETSVQARFLIPMAISLGFGVLFSTFVILLLVPALYQVLEDLRAVFGLTSADDIEKMVMVPESEVVASE